MDVSKGSIDEAWGDDTGKDSQSQQLALDIVGGENDSKANDKSEKSESDKPQSGGASTCTHCGRGINPDDESTFKEIRSWVYGAKKDSAVLRTYTGRQACSDCISNLRSGIAPDQPNLNALLDATPEERTTESIYTDRSPAYIAGFAAGIAGKVKNTRSTTNLAKKEYMEGFEDGRSKRDDVKNPEGSSVGE
jgi:hypothetical protein